MLFVRLKPALRSRREKQGEELTDSRDGGDQDMAQQEQRAEEDSAHVGADVAEPEQVAAADHLGLLPAVWL